MGSSAGFRLSGSFLVCLVMFLPAVAEARIIRIDQGLNWGTPVIVNVESDGSASAPIGFPINFGQGLIGTLTIHENGFASLAGGHTITALGVDFSSDALATDPESTGAVSYNQGLIDPGAEFQPGVTPPDAFRVQWVDQTAFQVMQILLVDRGGGDFDLEINHGCDERPRCDGITPVGSALALMGFDLGDASFSQAGPFGASNDFTFVFRDGKLVSVVEPGTAPLLLAGLAMLAWLWWRRRATRTGDPLPE